MRWPVVQDHYQLVHPSAACFLQQHPTHKRLKVCETLARSCRAEDLAIRHTQSREQIASPTPMIPWREQHRRATPGWPRRLFSLTSLDRGLLINTPDPGSLGKQAHGLSVELQDWAGPFKEALGRENVLPGVE